MYGGGTCVYDGETYVCMMVKRMCIWWWNVCVYGGGTYVYMVVKRMCV